MIHFSLLLPTRGRPDLLDRFLESVLKTAAFPEKIEIVIVTDEDDITMKGYTFPQLNIKSVEFVSGKNMGELNQAAFEASTGQYVFLVNDDIIVQTPRWDERIMEVVRRYPDGLFLVHVNDLLFQEHLCTFPLVSRTFCEIAGGICPDEYYRHRIDDHIYNVFNMLAYLGHKRILYLPDVVFEHDHYTLDDQGNRVYYMENEIHEPDVELFEQLFDQRKELTIRLTEYIETFRQEHIREVKKLRLDELPDSFCIRNPDYIHIQPELFVPDTSETRVTIGVVSADHNSGAAQTCLSSIKKHTSNYELILLDNNFYSNFNHAADMNRIMEACSTDYLVLMDDDVVVEEGWLDALLSCMDGKTGVATPAHMDGDGDISYAGIVFRPDRSGHHGHMFELPPEPAPIMTMSSAVFMVDMNVCGHLRFDETMAKYFLDLDYGLQVWESGARLILAPQVPVTHIGGATLKYGSEDNLQQWEKHRRLFAEKWFASGRIDRLAETRFSQVPELSNLWNLIGQVGVLFEELPSETLKAYAERARRVYDQYASIPVLNQYVIDQVWTKVKKEGIGNAHMPGKWPLAYLSSLYGRQVSVGEYDDYTVWFYKDRYWGVPKNYGKIYIRSLLRMNRPGLLNLPDLDALHRAIRKTGPFQSATPADGQIVETIDDRVILNYDNLYMPCRKKTPGVPLVPGAVFFSREAARSCIHMEKPQFINTIEGHQVYKFHHMYFASEGLSEMDMIEATSVARKALRAHTVPQIREEICLKSGGAKREKLKTAMFCTLPEKEMQHYIGMFDDMTSLIYLPDDRKLYNGQDSMELTFREGVHPDFDLHRVDPEWIEAFKSREFDAIILPCHPDYSWEHNLPERLASSLTQNVILLDKTGTRHSFTGERAQRLQYNKANLCMAFQKMEMGRISDVLEVGCSDGLACELLSMTGMKRIHGVDTSALPALMDSSNGIQLKRGDAVSLDYQDNSFDFVFSIAVLEHVADPQKAILEMIRVTRPGGYCYIQTAPLFHSPWGHHMPYFKEPWAHLKYNEEELIEQTKGNGIGQKIEEELSIGAEYYIRGMLCPDHINGLTLKEFGFDELLERNDIEVIFRKDTHEGRELLPEKERARLWDYTFGELTDHGIHVLVKKL